MRLKTVAVAVIHTKEGTECRKTTKNRSQSPAEASWREVRGFESQMRVGLAHFVPGLETLALASSLPLAGGLPQSSFRVLSLSLCTHPEARGFSLPHLSQRLAGIFNITSHF